MTLELPDPSTSRAVLVGFPRYESEDFPDRPTIAANIRALAQLLADRTVLGLPPRHIIATEETADAGTVLKTIYEAAVQATDTLLVYFAGHGFLDDGGELEMAVYECDRKRTFLALKYRDLRRIVLQSCRARFKVTMLDCCFSGAAAGLGGGGERDFARQTVIDGTCVMTACSGTQIAQAPPNEQYTAYTGQLIAAMSEGVEGAEAFLTPQTLNHDVIRRLRARNFPDPTIAGTGEGLTTPLVHNLSKPRPVAPPVIDPAAPARTEDDMWRYIDAIARPALAAAANPSLLVSCFAKHLASLLRADIVFVDQRIGPDGFEPIAEFRSSDRRMHKPERPRYTCPVGTVESAGSAEAGRSAAAVANDGAVRSHGTTWAVFRSVQVWRVGELPERRPVDLWQAYAAWSAALIDRALQHALAVPVFSPVEVWGQVLVGRSAAAGPFVEADRLGAAFLVEAFSSVLSRLAGRPGAAPPALSVAQLTAQARALRVELRAQRGPRSNGGGS